MSEPFEVLEHTADIGFRAWGATAAELFENAAQAMMSIAAETETIDPRGRLVGEARDPARHRWKLIVKAVTYHDIEVFERDGRWESRIFLDI